MLDKLRGYWENCKRWYARDDWNKITAFAALVALILIMFWCTAPAESDVVERLDDGEWLGLDGEKKYFSRVWGDGRRFRIDIYVQPEMDCMLIRIHEEWWIDGDRGTTTQVQEIAAPLPPRIIYWIEKRAGKHLDRLEDEGVYVRPE